MIERPTTLILGAGASFDYGFPLGIGLFGHLEPVLRWYPRDWVRPSVLPPDQFPAAEDATSLWDALQTSLPLSIDRFLMENEPLQTIGKFAIAAAILRLENASIGTGPWKGEGGWYRQFTHAVLAPRGESKLPVRIVTFNYDRSFERFAYRTLSTFYGPKSPAEVIELYHRHFQVIHVYGSVGSLRELDPSGSEFGVATPENALRGATSLETISRDVEPATFAVARKWISEASYLAVLGFGFLLENVDRLGFRDSTNRKIFFCSGYGLSVGQRMRIQNQFAPHDFYFGDIKHDIAAFLHATDFLGWASIQCEPNLALLTLQGFTSHQA